MKIRTAIVVACVATLGLADLAIARNTSGHRPHAKRHTLAKAAIHSRKAKTGSGVTVSTGDVNGDGTSDVVTSNGSGAKNKPAR